MKTLSLPLAVFFLITLSVSRADTTITNTTTTETYTTASHGSKNLNAINSNGTGTLVLSSSSNTSFNDSSSSYNVTNGGAETIDITNSGSGTFTFNLGGIGRTPGGSINFEESTTGGAAILTSAVRLSNGAGAGSSNVTGNDLTFWAYYNGNDWAATSTSAGGTVGSAASEYNDGGHDASATNLSTWSSNAYEDYTDDTATAYSGSLTANAEKHGIRFANSAGANLNFNGHIL